MIFTLFFAQYYIGLFCSPVIFFPNCLFVGAKQLFIGVGFVTCHGSICERLDNLDGGHLSRNVIGGVDRHLYVARADVGLGDCPAVALPCLDPAAAVLFPTVGLPDDLHAVARDFGLSLGRIESHRSGVGFRQSELEVAALQHDVCVEGAIHTLRDTETTRSALLRDLDRGADREGREAHVEIHVPLSEEEDEFARHEDGSLDSAFVHGDSAPFDVQALAGFEEDAACAEGDVEHGGGRPGGGVHEDVGAGKVEGEAAEGTTHGE